MSQNPIPTPTAGDQTAEPNVEENKIEFVETDHTNNAEATNLIADSTSSKAIAEDLQLLDPADLTLLAETEQPHELPISQMILTPLASIEPSQQTPPHPTSTPQLMEEEPLLLEIQPSHIVTNNTVEQIPHVIQPTVQPLPTIDHAINTKPAAPVKPASRAVPKLPYQRSKRAWTLVSLLILTALGTASGLAWQQHNRAKATKLPSVATPAVAAPKAPPQTPQAKGQAIDLNKKAAAKLATMVAPEPVIEPLTVASVDHASYASLLAGVKALSGNRHSNPQNIGLINWARFRLAHSFGDTAAAKILLQETLTPPTAKQGPLAMAAYLGATWLRGKDTPLRNKPAKTPQVMYVQALPRDHAKTPDVKKLLRLKEAFGKKKHMPDVLLLLLGQQIVHDPAKSTTELLELANTYKTDPDVLAQVAQILIEHQQTAVLPALLKPIGDTVWPQHAAPAHQDMLWRLQLRARLHEGDIPGATQAAYERYKQAFNTQEAPIELARLLQYTKIDDGTAILKDASALHPESQSYLLDELLRMTLAQSDIAQARKIGEQIAALNRQQTKPTGFGALALARLQIYDGQQALATQALIEAQRDPKTVLEAKSLLFELAPKHQMADLANMVEATHSSWLTFKWIKALSGNNQAEEALRLMESLLWVNPTMVEPIELISLYIHILESQPHNEQAKASALFIAQNLAAKSPNDDRTALLLTRIAQMHHAYKIVIDSYQSLLKRHPYDRDLSMALAEIFLTANLPRETIQLLESLARVNPEIRHPDFLNLLGRAWSSIDVLKARGYFQAAIAMKPETKSYVWLGQLEEGRGKIDEAMIAYQEALKLTPQNTELHLHLCQLLFNKGMLPACITHLQQMLQQNPQNAAATEMLGDVQREMGQHTLALAEYNKALIRAANKEALLMKIACLQLDELGLIKEATATLEQIIKINPRNAEAYYHLGYAWRDLENTAKAKQALYTYLRLNPKGEFTSEVNHDLAEWGAR